MKRYVMFNNKVSKCFQDRKILFFLWIIIQMSQILSQKLNGCSIQIVVDPFLRQHLEQRLNIQGSSEADIRREIVFFIGKHIHFVNSVIEKYNFSPTGENLKLFLHSIKILDFSNCNHKGINYCVVQIGDLLSLHSSVNHEDFCLSYVFTYRDLGEGFIGKAWKASSNNADEGGVCSHFVEGYNIQPDNFEDDSLMPKLERYTNASSKAISQSRNTGLVSLKYNGEMIPEYVSKLVFLHEIGHSLGSGHDSSKNCLDSTTSDFVMNPHGCLYGFYHNESRFSDWSVRNISIAMRSLKSFTRNCFVSVPASICGNGLVEAWEECDCGENEKECETDPCCFPADHLEFPCQRKPKATCSPSEGKCCNNQCKLIGKSENSVCTEETECSLSSVCDGTSSTCPSPRPKSNALLCRGGTMTCFNGECGLSICHKFNMVPCKPSSIQKACEVHCQSPGRSETCEPSSEIYPLFSEPAFHPVNTFCFGGQNADNETVLGYCSGENYCKAKVELPLSAETWLIGLIVFLVCYVLITAFGVWIYCNYCKGKIRFRQVQTT